MKVKEDNEGGRREKEEEGEKPQRKKPKVEKTQHYPILHSTSRDF